MRRHVSARLELEVRSPIEAALQLAVARADGLTVDEQWQVTLDGVPLPRQTLHGPYGGRTDVVRAGPGRLVVAYEASVSGRAAPPEVDPFDRWTNSWPSRYCPSDGMVGFAATEFRGLERADLLASVSSWVGQRLAYVPGSSGPTDGAVDTLLTGAGVCRDYAHLVIALLRALDVPARLVAVYAPGLQPMDFHAVAEALVDGSWRVVDATLLAPRSTLVRIATGRDAADTSFLTTSGGEVELLTTWVGATVDGALPGDDPQALATLG